MHLKININCIRPKIPKTGYKLFIKFENPRIGINISVKQINILYFLYFSFVLDILFKNPYADDIAVVIIAPIIIMEFQKKLNEIVFGKPVYTYKEIRN